MRKLYIKKMNCQHCEAKIKNELEKNKIEFRINLSEKTVEVTEDKASVTSNVLGKIGYPAEVI